MSIRFSIKHTQSKAEKESDGTIIRFTGYGESFSRVSGRDGRKVGVDAAGEAKLKYVTGLDKSQVQFFKWYSKEEQAIVEKQIEELTPIIEDFYGKEVLDSTNRYFWGDNRDVNRLSLTNEDIDVFYDTKNPSHALLYLSIVAGAFAELVAPTKDWAQRSEAPHYLSLESEEQITDDDDDITKSDAHAALAELRKEESPEALRILAWCLQYGTNAFGGINNATPNKSLIQAHINYINGKLVSKKKRNMPKTFIEYVEKWQGQQTRPKLYTEAYVKAGEYFNFVNHKEKKYVTSEGTVLGNTIDEAVETLTKPKFTEDLKKLRSQVEAKWAE